MMEAVAEFAFKATFITAMLVLFLGFWAALACGAYSLSRSLINWLRDR